MVEDGVSVNSRDEYERTGLHIACDLELEAVVKVLLALGADVSATERGLTALHVACARGNVEMVRVLLEAGASLGLQDLQGFTALHTAVFYARHKVVELLLDKGASVTALTKAGKTPLNLAESNGDFVLAGLLSRVAAAAGVEQRPRAPPVVAASAAGRSSALEMEFDDDLPPLEPAVVTPVLDDDLPELEPANAPLTISAPSPRAAPTSSSVSILPSTTGAPATAASASPAPLTAPISIPTDDLSWRPTDTYSALKRKLELANALIAKLRHE